jgi:hypothetical protein
MTFERIVSALGILVMELYTQIITLEGLFFNSMGIGGCVLYEKIHIYRNNNSEHSRNMLGIFLFFYMIKFLEIYVLQIQ